MEAIDVLVKKKSYILIYPEQYMWWNYKKPRPFKDGAFRFACKHNCPVVPCFITIEDSKEFKDGDIKSYDEFLSISLGNSKDVVLNNDFLNEISSGVDKKSL